MTDTPIACRLSEDALRCASADLLPGLARRAGRIVRSTDGAELIFSPASDLLSHVARVLDAERECCRFLHFTLDIPPADADIRLTVSGPIGTGMFLESLDSAFAAP
jgi:hypothetical protein